MMNNTTTNNTNATAKRMTKRDYFNILLNEVVEKRIIVDNNDITADVRNFINHELELLDKKSATSRKTLTPTQKANLVVMEEIRRVLTIANKPLTIPEMQEMSADLAQYKSQKLSALLNKSMVEEITKSMEKKKAYFTLKSLTTETIEA